MPHIIIKLHPGRSDDQKTKLAEEIAKDVVAISGCTDEVVSISFEEVSKEDWKEKVYKPDILDKWDAVVKKPGYNPFKD